MAANVVDAMALNLKLAFAATVESEGQQMESWSIVENCTRHILKQANPPSKKFRIM